MTATVEAEPQHGTLAAYSWHYRAKTPVCQECRAASTAYKREQKERRRAVGAVSVVPVGWPCADCEWTERLGTSDGRVVSWRVERCPKHQGAW